MNKTGSAAKVKLSSYDDLFGNAEEKTGSEEQIIRAKLTDLHEFRNHPFRVLDDEKMEETTESISKYGVLVPGIARPRAEGGYEIIAGHRRKRGSERAGKEDMPVIVRNYTDDEATIIMVDSNIQREDILPSEKAKAYAMKYEAMKHQGRKGNGNTLDEVGEAAGESGKTVQRYIWLARLSDELLELVDRKKIGLVQGVDISFLSEDAQQWVLVILEESGANISTVQSAKLKEYGKLLTQFLNEKLLLEFNDRCALRPNRCGCEFVGCVIYPDHVLLRKSTTLRMKKNLRRVAEKYKKYEVSFDYCKQVAASYAGMLEHVDGNRFKDKLWEDFVLTHNMEE